MSWPTLASAMAHVTCPLARLPAALGITQMHVSRLAAHALGHLRTRLLGPQDHPGGTARPAADRAAAGRRA